MSDYGLIERVLHRLSLGHPAVAEMAFSLEKALFPAPSVYEARHVYVAGLARAGTTILMRRIHESGAFRSLTYANMPFVLAPNLWRSMRPRRSAPAKAGERAHGDGITVDTDSPESFEEVFWRTFAGEDYIGRRQLFPHDPSVQLLGEYRRFVAAVLRAGGARRYLCKNNNNILRLTAIKRAFPNARIVIPYRHPLDQAASLLEQHRRFMSLQNRDGFVKAYMNWLVHHEFGGGHRPFALGRSLAHPPDTLAYWIEQWIAVYEWLEVHAPGDAIWVRYEDLCEDPACWRRLATAIDVPEGNGDLGFRRPQRKTSDVSGLPDGLLPRASSLYDGIPCA